MNHNIYRLWWIFFSLFVWFHFALNIYPLPSQRTDEIEAQALEAVQNSNELASKGVKRDEYMKMSKEEWIYELKTTYWATWIINFTFFLFGLISTLLLYIKLKIWPILLGATSILCLAYLLLPYAYLESPFNEWKSLMKVAFENSYYSTAYYASAFPAFLILLLTFSIRSAVKNVSNKAA